MFCGSSQTCSALLRRWRMWMPPRRDRDWHLCQQLLTVGFGPSPDVSIRACRKEEDSHSISQEFYRCRTSEVGLRSGPHWLLHGSAHLFQNPILRRIMPGFVVVTMVWHVQHLEHAVHE